MWSLKALDRYVIGDDEIIEEVTFIKRFQAQNPTLFVDLCPQKEKVNLPTKLFVATMLIMTSEDSCFARPSTDGCHADIIHLFYCRKYGCASFKKYAIFFCLHWIDN